MPETDLTALILAGGRASRMDGRDKGLLPLAGQPLVARVIAGLAGEVAQVIISANRNVGEYAAFGYPVVNDDEAGFEGPLAGILAGLGAASTPFVLTAPCDAPRVAAVYVRRMVEARRTHAARACAAGCFGELQPVFSLLATDLAADLALYMADGGRKTGAWIERLDPVVVDFSDHPEMFDNVNTPDELAALETALETAS